MRRFVFAGNFKDKNDSLYVLKCLFSFAIELMLMDSEKEKPVFLDKCSLSDFPGVTTILWKPISKCHLSKTVFPINFLPSLSL